MGQGIFNMSIHFKSNHICEEIKQKNYMGKMPPGM
jgi:hypothetical protein